MSNNLRQAAQQALEALENAYMVNSWAWVDQKKQVITALQAALSEPEQAPISLNNGRLTQYPDGSIGVGTPAKPEQEPVAWLDPESGEVCRASWLNSHAPEHHVDRFTCPLYTTPTPRRPLTDEMVKRMKEVCTSMEMRGAFADGWLSAEAAHGITGEGANHG